VPEPLHGIATNAAAENRSTKSKPVPNSIICQPLPSHATVYAGTKLSIIIISSSDSCSEKLGLLITA
jgi:hypothetical protein